ncbi:ATP-binding cassette domain-containing protein [Methylococcus geothermalis]|uniref:ATP-binding cassette domain-containing protein n=1 Tax=Methylococcus geothermalis TaxID=2681310 RepID=A0A858Q9V0_9GAMM|nr:ATP-binding cassette domain-containing protein [Methylococcus geothermalis]QJD30535.1 ATP-binding cassette domain-containing protein [Methylococcus geothermalis]
MDTLLELQNLTLSLGQRQVLGGIGLSIARGDIHALVGANGAGKSCLAYAIMGCEGYRPQQGTILFEGRRIDELPIQVRARLGITLAWQEPARFEGLRVSDYLHLGSPPGDPITALEAVGLSPTEYLDRPVDNTLSGGERKRIELAAIITMRPKLAILDEPAAGIDLLSLDELVAAIQAMQSIGSTILLITHVEQVAAHADRASQLCGGQIVCQGETQAVIENYKARRCRRCDGEICRHV